MSYAPPPSGSKITGSSSDAGARETTVDGLFQRAKDYTVLESSAAGFVFCYRSDEALLVIMQNGL